ncbi:MAG: Rrf2 family transcriptional regulator [Acidobacteriaceae bacterium]|nr:Rrf2 family transcriptional regulator [Acidobacteriaceae bacterium]
MLRLTKKADYSLIALKHFAARQRESGEAVSAKEVADTCGIPLPLLSKLLQKLGKTGFLVSEYGTNGGYRLARDPGRISALEVIRAIDGPVVLANCFTDSLRCDHSSRCTVRRPLKRIHEAILRLLESVSIQDMLQDSEDAGQHESMRDTLVALQTSSKNLDPHGPLGTGKEMTLLGK